MRFDWNDYLDLAQRLEELIDGCGEDACRRSAVSRAYYAAYCLARNYAIEMFNFPPSPKSDRYKDHGLVRDIFKDKGVIDVSSGLDDLRHWRNDCDYEDEVPYLLHLCQDAIESAEEVIGHLT